MDSPEVFALKNGVVNEETQELAIKVLKELYYALNEVLDYKRMTDIPGKRNAQEK